MPVYTCTPTHRNKALNIGQYWMRNRGRRGAVTPGGLTSMENTVLIPAIYSALRVFCLIPNVYFL